MAIYQYDVVFKCPKCGLRISRCSEDYKCLRCHNGIKDTVENACASVNAMTLMIPVLFVFLIILHALT